MIFKAAKYLTCAALLFVSTSAAAQDMEDFKKRMADAAAMTKVDMTAALQQYLETRILYAGPEVDYSLGRAYQRMNQCANAQYYYTQVMVAYNLPEDNPIYQRAVKAFDEIASCTEWQQVTLECMIPADGHVMIDGERVTSCWDRPMSMSAGEHKFTLSDAKGKTKEFKLTAKDGAKPAKLRIEFPPEKVEVERVVEVEHNYYYKEKFNPALYWGLITGGVAVVAIGGFMTGMAYSSYADEQKYADRYAILQKDEDKKKADDAHDKVKSYNIASYTLIGVGGALALTGAALAIVNAVSEKEQIEDNTLNAYVSPSADGVSVGLGFKF